MGLSCGTRPSAAKTPLHPQKPLPAPTPQVCSAPHRDLETKTCEPLVSSCDKTVGIMETESWTLVNVPVSDGHLGKSSSSRGPQAQTP